LVSAEGNVAVGSRGVSVTGTGVGVGEEQEAMKRKMKKEYVLRWVFAWKLF